MKLIFEPSDIVKHKTELTCEDYERRTLLKLGQGSSITWDIIKVDGFKVLIRRSLLVGLKPI